MARKAAWFRVLKKVARPILNAQKIGGLGAKVISQLSKDLRSEFSEMKGFSPQNLKYMRKLSEEYNLKEIGQQAVDQIPWGHIIVLLYSGLDKTHIYKLRIKTFISIFYSTPSNCDHLL